MRIVGPSRPSRRSRRCSTTAPSCRPDDITRKRTPSRTSTGASYCALTRRVLGQLFVPGHASAGETEEGIGVVAHVLDLNDDELSHALADIEVRFGQRHRDLTEMFERHADRLSNRLLPDVELSERQRRLLGATFTQEYAVEATSVILARYLVRPVWARIGGRALRAQCPSDRRGPPLVSRLPPWSVRAPTDAFRSTAGDHSRPPVTSPTVPLMPHCSVICERPGFGVSVLGTRWAGSACPPCQLDERLHELEVSRTRAWMSPTPCPGSIQRAAVLRRRSSCSSASGGTCAHSVVRGRVQRHRGRPVGGFVGDDGSAPTTPPTRRSTAWRVRSSSRRGLPAGSRLDPPRSRGAATKGWLCSRAIDGFYACLPSRWRELYLIIGPAPFWYTNLFRCSSRRSVELRPGRQLRISDRARRGMVGADPRRRPDARTRSAHCCLSARPDDRSGPNRSSARSPAPSVTGTAMCRTSSTLAAWLRHDDHILLPLGTADSRISFATLTVNGVLTLDSATTEMRHPWPTSHHANINRRRPASR